MSLHDLIPRYLVEKYQLVATVTFTALFSVVLLLLTVPFTNETWFALGDDGAFLYTALFFLVSMAVIVISKRIMYNSRNIFALTYIQYILWCFAEVLAISLVYVFMTIEGVQYGILCFDVTPSYNKMFLESLVFGTISLGVPYLVAGQYFAINDKNNTIRLMNFGSVVSDAELPPQTEKKITLFDNTGVLKLVVSQSNLYYIESDDNYIKVWYEDISGELKQYMLRCRLKTVEDSFTDSDLVRCHRKYIVNMSKVRMISREKDAYYIDLDVDSVNHIPISKTYEDKILSKFNSK